MTNIEKLKQLIWCQLQPKIEHELPGGEKLIVRNLALSRNFEFHSLQRFFIQIDDEFFTLEIKKV